MCAYIKHSRYRGFDICSVKSEGTFSVFVGKYTEEEFISLKGIGSFVDLEDSIPYAIGWVDTMWGMVYEGVREESVDNDSIRCEVLNAPIVGFSVIPLD